MARITFIEFDGTSHTVEADRGTSLMEAARMNDIRGIDGDCGGACACATCHVFVDRDWIAVTGMASGDELDLLEFSDERTEYSRLSCQLIVSDELNGLVVRLPAKQG